MRLGPGLVAATNGGLSEPSVTSGHPFGILFKVLERPFPYEFGLVFPDY